MGKITDISRQKRNKSRVSVFIDGEFACGLDAVTAAASRIAIGDEIDADELKKLVFESEVASAFERAVGYLSGLPRARKEIYIYLLRKEYDRDVIAEVMRRLDSYRYTDDRAYAEAYISSKSKKYGTMRIKAELIKKGVDSAIISELLDDTDEDATCQAQKYVRTHRNADIQKLKRFLYGRGYTWDAISAAVDAVKSELSAGDDNTDYD